MKTLGYESIFGYRRDKVMGCAVFWLSETIDIQKDHKPKHSYYALCDNQDYIVCHFIHK